MAGSEIVSDDEINAIDVMRRYEFEQKDTKFTRGCILCREQITCGSRSDFVRHLFSKHNFWLGPAENLVFMDDLFDLLADYLDRRFQCFYCDGKFPSRQILLEHARKKQHKRLNPHNREFDRFFLINNPISSTLPSDRQKSEQGSDTDYDSNTATSSNENDEPDWSDWCDDGHEVAITCLFCTETSTAFDLIIRHMLSEHAFDYRHVTENLDFYATVMLVNLIRRQISKQSCPFCALFKFDQLIDLNKHLMTVHKHLNNVMALLTDQSLYYPVMENDTFLFHIED